MAYANHLKFIGRHRVSGSVEKQAGKCSDTQTVFSGMDSQCHFSSKGLPDGSQMPPLHLVSLLDKGGSEFYQVWSLWIKDMAPVSMLSFSSKAPVSKTS